jgi:hypothetical protein
LSASLRLTATELAGEYAARDNPKGKRMPDTPAMIVCGKRWHNTRPKGKPRTGRMTMLRTAAAALIALAAAIPALAIDNGQYSDVPDNIRSWFKSVRAPSGVPCCDIADGHRTSYDIRGDGYWIPIPDAPPGQENWMPVPPEAVVHDAGNPVGEAVVWWVHTGGDPTAPDPTRRIHIRCFVPGGGV